MQRLYAALLLAVPAVAAAQAPRITPGGDPSIRNDSIYRLAVDPADYKDDAQIYLLDDGVVRLEADGRGTTTYRHVTQILKESAVRRTAEQSLQYAPDHQKLTVNWVRVVKPNGQVISDKPAQIQDSDVPASMSNPVYMQLKVRRMSLSGIAVGTIVDMSYTIEETKPYFAGDFYSDWYINSSVPIVRSRFMLDVPAAVQPLLVERKLSFAAARTEGHGRRVYSWITRDVAKVRFEALAPDSSASGMSVSYALPHTWGDVAKWYAGLARDRYAITAPVEAKLHAILAGARTRDDTIRAIHGWVTQDVRYVSVSLGLGGYQPRSPDQVLATGFGDCKDKATLFVAALNRFGITAYPVLLSSTGGVERRLPTIRQFDHAIAAVKQAEGYLFIDLTSDYTPIGDLPPQEQGGFALVVLPDGSADEVTLPMAAVAGNRSEVRYTGSLSDDGVFTGSYEEHIEGTGTEGSRQTYAAPIDSARRVTLFQVLVRRLPGARADSIVAFDGKDLRAPVRVARFFSGWRATARSGESEIFNIPIAAFPATHFIDALEGGGPRQLPIDVGDIFGTGATVQEVTLTLPSGWKARLPRAISAESEFGTYSAEYTQTGRDLHIVRRTIPASGVFGPERTADVVAWLKTVAVDEDTKLIVIDRQ